MTEHRSESVIEATDYVYYSIADEFPNEDIHSVANLADDIIDKLLEFGWEAP